MSLPRWADLRRSNVKMWWSSDSAGFSQSTVRVMLVDTKTVAVAALAVLLGHL